MRFFPITFQKIDLTRSVLYFYSPPEYDMKVDQ